MLHNAQKHLLFAITLLIGLSVCGAEDTVARVIYAEAGPQCSAKERHLVASVVFNRIDHNGFGKPIDGLDVVTRHKAFSAYKDMANMNWTGSSTPNLRTGAWLQTRNLSKGIKDRTIVPVPNVHYFLTKGTPIPKGYYSPKYWTLTVAYETEHFTFYRITVRVNV